MSTGTIITIILGLIYAIFRNQFSAVGDYLTKHKQRLALSIWRFFKIIAGYALPVGLIVFTMYNNKGVDKSFVLTMCNAYAMLIMNFVFDLRKQTNKEFEKHIRVIMIVFESIQARFKLNELESVPDNEGFKARQLIAEVENDLKNLDDEITKLKKM